MDSLNHTPNQSHRYAMVFNCSMYDDKALGRSLFDSRKMTKYLKSKEYETEQIENPDIEQISEALTRFINTLKENSDSQNESSNYVIYYSGFIGKDPSDYINQCNIMLTDGQQIDILKYISSHLTDNASLAIILDTFEEQKEKLEENFDIFWNVYTLKNPEKHLILSMNHFNLDKYDEITQSENQSISCFFNFLDTNTDDIDNNDEYNDEQEKVPQLIEIFSEIHKKEFDLPLKIYSLKYLKNIILCQRDDPSFTRIQEKKEGVEKKPPSVIKYDVEEDYKELLARDPNAIENAFIHIDTCTYITDYPDELKFDGRYSGHGVYILCNPEKAILFDGEQILLDQNIRHNHDQIQTVHYHPKFKGLILCYKSGVNELIFKKKGDQLDPIKIQIPQEVFLKNETVIGILPSHRKQVLGFTSMGRIITVAIEKENKEIPEIYIQKIKDCQYIFDETEEILVLQCYYFKQNDYIIVFRKINPETKQLKDKWIVQILSFGTKPHFRISGQIQFDEEIQGITFPIEAQYKSVFIVLTETNFNICDSNGNINDQISRHKIPKNGINSANIPAVSIFTRSQYMLQLTENSIVAINIDQKVKYFSVYKNYYSSMKFNEGIYASNQKITLSGRNNEGTFFIKLSNSLFGLPKEDG